MINWEFVTGEMIGAAVVQAISSVAALWIAWVMIFGNPLKCEDGRSPMIRRLRALER